MVFVIGGGGVMRYALWVMGYGLCAQPSQHPKPSQPSQPSKPQIRVIRVP